MGMTITEKILAAHADKDYVEPGEIVDCRIDLAMANDITAPLSLEEFEKVGAKKVFDPNKVVFVLDHFTPNKDILSAENIHKLINRIKNISMLLQTFQNQFLLPGAVFNFFFHISVTLFQL